MGLAWFALQVDAVRKPAVKQPDNVRPNRFRKVIALRVQSHRVRFLRAADSIQKAHRVCRIARIRSKLVGSGELLSRMSQFGLNHLSGRQHETAIDDESFFS